MSLTLSIEGYKISQEGVNKMFTELANTEINHSNQYTKLYDSAKKQGDDKTAELAKEYIMDSLQSLQNLRTVTKLQKMVTVDIESLVDKQLDSLKKTVLKK